MAELCHVNQKLLQLLVWAIPRSQCPLLEQSITMPCSAITKFTACSLLQQSCIQRVVIEKVFWGVYCCLSDHDAIITFQELPEHSCIRDSSLARAHQPGLHERSPHLGRKA